MMVIASTALFCLLYPNYKKRTILFIIFALSIIIPSITAARQMTGILGSENFIESFTQMMQQYLGSPYNIAIAVEASEIYAEHGHLFNLIYDFARPTFGLNLLVKDLPLQFSNQFFNYRMYLDNRIIQIIPMIGEGYFYLGFIFSPILSMLFVKFADLLTKQLKKSNQIEITYFLTITCTRMGFLMGQNASIQMNDMSFTLFVPLLLYWLNKKIVSRRQDLMIRKSCTSEKI